MSASVTNLALQKKCNMATESSSGTADDICLGKCVLSYVDTPTGDHVGRCVARAEMKKSGQDEPRAAYALAGLPHQLLWIFSLLALLLHLLLFRFCPLLLRLCLLLVRLTSAGPLRQKVKKKNQRPWIKSKKCRVN
jgi:hypothetical protein